MRQAAFQPLPPSLLPHRAQAAVWFAQDRPQGVAWRRPQHPGWWLARYCLAPLCLTQTEAARLLGMSRRRLHELVHGQRTMTADTALRCARHFGVGVDFWLSRQAAWDAYHAWRQQAGSPCGPDAQKTAPCALLSPLS